MNEKVNTARTLAGMSPLITKFSCRLGFHSWTKWSETFHQKGHHFQDRHCAGCNKRQVTRVTANYF